MCRVDCERRQRRTRDLILSTARGMNHDRVRRQVRGTDGRVRGRCQRCGGADVRGPQLP